MKTYKLSSDQKSFFRAVAEAAFCNPFSSKRHELDLKIAEMPACDDQLALLEKVITRVGAELKKLASQGADKLNCFSAGDAEIMHTCFLFEIYHRFMVDFDAHIAKQLAGGDKPLSVSFAADIMRAFNQRGFDPVEACRYMAFFFQMRRAFYFLDRGLVGNCPSMQEFRCRLWSNIFTQDSKWFRDHLWNRMEDFSTLILGATGAGKGAAAAAIGRSGHIPFDEQTGRFKESFTKNFIARNLSQFPETLIESELFGHKKGSFTGAIKDYAGIFAQCSPHGTIFLDEIGDLSPSIQIKLLHVLQERVFSPVGDHGELRFSGRIIAATNRPLKQLRQAGQFRDDFYYRISSDVIRVPSLSQRIQEDPSEVKILLRAVIERIVTHCTPELVDEVAGMLDKSPGRNYAWPGNVRELEQAVRRIFLTGSYAGEEPEPSRSVSSLDEILQLGELSAQDVLHHYCGMLYLQHGTYEKVASISGLDRRTVKKYVQAGNIKAD